MKTRALRTALAVSLVAAGAAWLLWPPQDCEAGRSSAAQPQAHSRRSGAAMSPTLARWSRGEVRNYRLQFHSRVTTKAQSLVDFELAGQWRLTALSVGSGRPLIEARLIDAKYSPNGAGAGADPETPAGFVEALASPVYFSPTSDGKVPEVRANSGLPIMARSILAYVAHAIQFVAAEHPATSWTTEEQDMIGRYSAKYVGLNQPNQFEKRKLDYLEVFRKRASAMQGINVSVDRSTARFEFAPNASGGGLLKQLDLSEVTSTEGGPLSTFASETSLRLGLETTLVAALDPALLARARTAKPISLTDADNSSTETTAARTGGMNLPEVLANFSALPESERAQRARLFVALSTLLQSNPAAVNDARARIVRGDSMSGLLLDALGSAGTRSAQAALLKLYDSGDLDDGQKHKAMLGLSMTRTPAKETVSWLIAHVDDPRHGGQAQGALGNAVYNSRSTAHHAWNALPVLLNQLAKDQSVGNLKQTLVALGAAGSPAALPQIEPFLAHAIPGVRAAAVMALRRIPGSQVDAMLAKALVADSAAIVRSTVLDVAKERQQSQLLGTAIESAARNDAAIRVRYGAVGLLLRWVGSLPSAADTLSWVVANETDPNVRQLASKGLEQLRRKG